MRARRMWPGVALFVCILLVSAMTAASAVAEPYGVAAWGSNTFGQLGKGVEGGRSTLPVAVSKLGKVVEVSAGENFGLALLSNGTVMAWGYNHYGTLGNGTSTNSSVPVVVSGLNEVIAIAAGGPHALALLRNGTVMTWGRNELGELGVGSHVGPENCQTRVGFPEEACSRVPVPVSGLSNVTAIAGGTSFSLALLSGGTVMAWGAGYYGQLGNGTSGSEVCQTEGTRQITCNTSPVPASGLTGVTAISANASNGMALLSSGAVMTWGRNANGELGNGSPSGPETCEVSVPCSRVPVSVVELSGVTAIRAGWTFDLALLSNGTVKAWGDNEYGQLGDGTTTGPEPSCGPCSSKPVSVSGLSGVTSVAGGIAFAMALLSNGSVMSWGDNSEGELGTGTTTGSSVPVAVQGLKGQAFGISAGNRFALAFGPEFPTGTTLVPSPEAAELLGLWNPGEPNMVRACAGKPVNCATGNETESQTDLTVGGRGLGLNVTRTYNAQAAVVQTTPGIFGYGWSASFTDHLSSNTGTVTVVQSNGSTVTFKTTGKSGEQSAPEWSQAKLVLNNDGTYTYTLPTQTTFHFNASGLLTSESDRSGNTTTLTRSTAGVLESVTDPAGRKLTFSYNPEGEVESVTDPLGHAVKYAYEAGNLVSVILPGEANPRWHYGYDSSHRLTTMTDGRSGTTKNEYESSNRVVSQTDPMGRTTRLEYEPRHTTIVNVATGSVTKEAFTEGDEPQSVTRGYGTASATTEIFIYDEAGDLKSVEDGNGHVTKYTYDPSGNRISMVDAAKDETKWTYNGTRDILSVVTPDGEKATYTRNGAGEPESVSQPTPGGTQTTKYAYNSVGEMESMTDPLGRTWKYEYDTQGNRTTETDPEGDKRTWTYDGDSREIASVSPRGNVVGAEASKYTTKIERDLQGRVLAITDPLGHSTKYSYDANGNVESETDPNGHKTTSTYNADNERTKVEAPNGAVTETSYDGAGQIATQTDGNKHTITYGRNILELVTEVTDPLGHKTTKEYDAAGNLVKVTDAAKRTTTYKYDAANRLKEISYSDGLTHAVQYEYNGDGKRTKMVDGTGTTTYAYDQLDRLTESKDGYGNITKYEYDLANEPVKITYPNGKTIERVYDKAGRMASVKDWLGHTTNFTYNPDSNLTTTTFPSGTSETDQAAYDEADQQTEAKISKGTETLASLVYARDSNGQITRTVSKGLPGSETVETGYDINERLTKAASTVYEYDAANNPTKLGSTTNTFNADDQLTETSGLKYTYDELGERTKMVPTTGATTTYGYNQAGDLTSVEKPKEGKTAGISDTNTYNGDGQWASQTIGTKTTYLAWDLTPALPLLLNDGTNSYIYGPSNMPVEQINSTEKPTYLHHDQAGSTRLLTGSTGTVEGSYTYTPYGGTEGHTGTATTPLGYDGQYTNSDTGLIYLRARVYDPATAQFLTVDPLEKLTRAPYNYVEDNPVNAVDPTGLCSDGSLSGFLDCFNPVSSGNIAYKGAVALNNETGINLPGLLTKPAVVDLGAAGVCATPLLDAGCPAALGAAWSVSTSSVVAGGIETNFCNPEQLAGEEGVTTLLAGFGALGVYTTGAAEAAGAPGYARGIIRGGPAALEALLNGPLAANGD